MSRPKKIRNNPFKAHIIDCIQRFLQNTPNTDAALLGNFDELGLSQVNKTKIMMKVINDNLNKEFVRVIFDDLPDKKQQYLVMKYKKDYSAVKIRVQLDVSYDCQCRWNNEIIQSIENMMFYYLTKEDLLSYHKVQSIISILDMQLYFYEQADVIKHIDLAYMNRLCQLQQHYQAIYRQLIAALESDYSSITATLLRHRRDKYYTKRELQEYCFCGPRSLKNVIDKFFAKIQDDYQAIESIVAFPS